MNRLTEKRMLSMAIHLMLILLVGPAGPGEASGAEGAKISAARQDQDGVLVHSVGSQYQTGTTVIRVLLPDGTIQGKRYRVVYVLPVESGDETRWGDGLAEVMRNDLHNRHQVIFVAPTFSHLPWYADHPTELEIRQETYFTNVVVPFVEQTYPVSKKPEDRLLLGFSKSGWGAWNLLLRHPQTFGRAAAWDAPLMMDRIGKYGTTKILGTQENFESYCLVDLLREKAEHLGHEKRLVLTGYGNFRKHHREMHSLLDGLKISHEYRDGPEQKHDWHSGWMPETVRLLIEASTETVEK